MSGVSSPYPAELICGQWESQCEVSHSFPAWVYSAEKGLLEGARD